MSDYPTLEELRKLGVLAGKISNPDFKVIVNVSDVVEFLKDVWWFPEYISFDKGTNEWLLTLVTSGWSGNETIIEELSETIFWMMYWQKSERGGKFTFKGDNQ